VPAWAASAVSRPPAVGFALPEPGTVTAARPAFGQDDFCSAFAALACAAFAALPLATAHWPCPRPAR
jgi:hypothetical protein